MGDTLGASLVISFRGMLSLPGDTVLPLPGATCKVVYEEPAAGLDLEAVERADLGPDGRTTEALLRILRILPRGGDVGEKTSCVSSGTLPGLVPLCAETDAAVNRLGVGERVLRLERSSGLTTLNGAITEVAREMATGSTGGEGVPFRITKLPRCGEGGPRVVTREDSVKRIDEWTR